MVYSGRHYNTEQRSLYKQFSRKRPASGESAGSQGRRIAARLKTEGKQQSPADVLVAGRCGPGCSGPRNDNPVFSAESTPKP